MNKEYERVKKEALLTDAEIETIYFAPTEATNLMESIRLSRRNIAQAQLDKTLKHKGIAILSDDQSLPGNPFFGGEPSDGKRTQWYGANSYKRLITEADFVKVVKGD